MFHTSAILTLQVILPLREKFYEPRIVCRRIDLERSHRTRLRRRRGQHTLHTNRLQYRSAGKGITVAALLLTLVGHGFQGSENVVQTRQTGRGGLRYLRLKWVPYLGHILW